MNDKEFNVAMDRIRKKDKSALREIYEEYVGFIYNVCLSVLKNKESAEDITSEFFIRLWEKAGQYKPGQAHKGYMATIARNMCIDYIRKYHKEELLDNDEEDNTNPLEVADEKTPENEVVESLSVDQALDRLKPIYRQIVTMKVLGDMTFKEIAEVLNIPMGTVTWNYQDAIKQLRRFGYE